ASAEEFAAALDAGGVVRRSSQRIPPVPRSGPIQLGSSDMLPDASYPPAVEVRTSDVIAAIPDPVGPPRAGDARDARGRAATPVAGTRAAAPAGGRAATPVAGT